jgi:hypothetical protein
MALLGIGQQLHTAWFMDQSVPYADALIRPWIAPWTAKGSASDPVWENWWWGAQVTVTGAPPGGTGSSAGIKRRRIKKSSEVFAEEMAKLEKQLEDAVAERVALENKLPEVPGAGPVPLEVQRFIIQHERAAELAQLKERLSGGIPVYVRIQRERTAALERMQRLVRIARHQEDVAREQLRVVSDQIDEEAAGAFMRWLMAEWEWD